MEPKVRVWVTFGKRLKLGAGRAQLLRMIHERGSLRRAAADFGMSYRAAWGYLQELEQVAGFQFVERTPGGGPHRGMRLTAAGREFLDCYQKFRRGLEASALRHFDRAFKGKEFRPRKRSPERSARARAEAG